MELKDFDYELPEDLIAQAPLARRDESRLMILSKETGEIKEKHFYDIIGELEKGDTLVLNDTKVLPARLIGEKEKTKAVMEVLLLKQEKEDEWECLVKPARRIHIGEVISFGNGKLKAECIALGEEGIRHFKFLYQGIFYEILEELGTMPLPPYIHEKLKDKDRYQTKIEDHKMHSEFYSVSEETAIVLRKTREQGHRVIAVGTTSTRTLETIYQKYGTYQAGSGWTNIYIYPGKEVKSIDGLITNFHLPKSTLIMLVSAIAGRENILHAYKMAVDHKYRFFSFGDAMFIK